MRERDVEFTRFFQRATGYDCEHPYQKELATAEDLRRLVDVPTGLGKTAAAILGWLWRRRFHPNRLVRSGTPRRLVYCLPMRVLVEQTFAEAIRWLDRLGLLAGRAEWEQPAESKGLKHYEPCPELDSLPADGWAAQHGFDGAAIAVHLLMGGEEKTDWALWPERDAVLVGTQDMLLSRALNRGYAAGRARWPLEFGLLNNDCLWVFDEVQLMDTGLATSLQLDAWRQTLLLRPTVSEFQIPTRNPVSKPCHSLWMSATMARHWLEKAVDWSSRVETEWDRRLRLTEAEIRSSELFRTKKQLVEAKVKTDNGDAERKKSEYLEEVAKHVRANHARSGLTLIILNTVDRAVELFRLLQTQPAPSQVPLKLIHSRFRPLEREQWRELFEERTHSPRILVSTQIVEAGVDLSAAVLYTELAPWPSLVQRFGRCARYPRESGKVFWLDLELGSDRQPVDDWAKPYERGELVAARQQLRQLADVGLNSLMQVKNAIYLDRDGTRARALFPYEPRFVPRDKDLFDLFDTTPDLTGADVDISRFIRDGEELDIQVFWREIPEGSDPLKKDRPHRRELCPVPFYVFRRALADLRTRGRVWRWSYRTGWELFDARDAKQVYPGQVYLLEKSCGGYSSRLGWTGKTDDQDFDLPAPIDPAKATSQDEEDEAEDLSQISQWLNVLEHTRDVCVKLDEILAVCDLPEPDRKVLRLAARWHDRGKAHSVFQSKLKADQRAVDSVQQKLGGQPAAKAPNDAWLKNGLRPRFRHELASALAILETLRGARPAHRAFAWPDGLSKSNFGSALTEHIAADASDPQMAELAELSADKLDLLIYLVAAHHGKVRMSIRSSPDDDRTDVPDPCPEDKRQARGVRDGDTLPACQIPASDLQAAMPAPEVTLSLDPMELGLSTSYGASWRERMQLLLEQLGPFRLAYLEGLLRVADCRASIEEDQRATPRQKGV